ncbi:MAG: prepilin-type N-terminal cleavage/methylation domain-containing protein [Desulfotomaculaceae bacterium]|nr:prepilin-type N-terminal cleavage/methylation domain-containing protein [Desulfotomaculaceae bacterium]
MQANKLLDNKKGLTIVELMITLAILLIVIGASYSFYFYVVRAFDIGTKQSDVQQNVRLAKNIIDNKVRSANYIAITESEPEAEWNQKIYLDNGKIMYVKDGDTTELLSGLADGFNMQIEFEKVGTSFLEISITGDINGEHVYNITSEVLIKAIQESKFVGDTGNVIYFKS